MPTIALIGAGGKMGCRITDNIMKGTNTVYYVEKGERGLQHLAARGLSATPQEEAVPAADVVILAVPDVAIGAVAADLVPKMKPGAILMTLDPAAAYLGKLPKREDVTYFVSHPCHPPVLNDETTPEAKRDFFGGVAAKQSIVCALIQGPDEHYAVAEAVAKEMYAPILRSHRIALEQMAMLEPTLAETISSMFVTVLGEALDEAVKRGVPYEAAKDFLMGHIHVQLGIVFEKSNPFSDACLVAIEYGRRAMLKDGWQKLFDADKVYDQIDVMLHPEKLPAKLKELEGGSAE